MTILHAHAMTPEPPGLFLELPTAKAVASPIHAIAGKSRTVRINKDTLAKERFFVSLPGGVSYEAVGKSRKTHGKGRYSWTGHASGNAENSVVIGISGNAIAGTFSYQDKLFKLEPRADGSHVLSEVKATDPAPELDPIAVADKTSVAPPAADTGSIAAADGSVIDVLVAFTPAIAALYGSEGADALVIQAVAEANQAYLTSGMTTRLNLVRSFLTDYIESGDMGTDLGRLRTTNDGYMDDLHIVRDIYGADLVSLIANAPQYCGLAYRMATLSPSFASSAFSVVHHSCATGYYSFAHEIGHNQGAHHDSTNATGAALFPYAYAYQEPNNTFRTIMSYNCVGGCARIGHFSNADILYSGVPTGVVGSAENADAIDQTAPTVAAFRERVTGLPPGC